MPKRPSEIPPGLTCSRCELPLSPAIARVDGGTLVHAGRCPCLIEGCDHRQHARGYCDMHYYRLRKFGHPLVSGVIETEDVEWLAETGESLEGAARRLNTTAKKLDAMLRGRGRTDLLHALRGLEAAA